MKKAPETNSEEQIIVTRSQLEQTKQFADPKTFVYDPSDMLERLELKARSRQKIATWTSTVLGQRQRKLADIERKKHQREEALKKIDADWAVVKAKERKEAQERAQRLLFYQEDRVRKFHSELLLKQVQKEQQVQIEFKQKQKEWRKKNEFNEKLSPFLKTEEQLAQDRDKLMQKWKETTGYWDAQQEWRKDREQKANQEMKDYYNDYCELLRAEVEREIDQQELKEQRHRKELLEAWALFKDEKKEQVAAEEIIENGTMEDCEKFKQHQKRLYQLIKERYQKELDDRRNRNEYTGEVYAAQRDKCSRPKSKLVSEMVEALKGHTLPVERGPNPANPEWFRHFVKDLESLRDNIVQQKIERHRENEKVFKAGMEDMIAMRREQQELREKDRHQRKNLMGELRIQAVETDHLRAAAKLEEALRNKKVFDRLAEEDRLVAEYRRNFQLTDY